MDENFRLSRHTSLWEEQNRLVKRTVFASLAFCLLLLINILKPYSSDLDKRNDIKIEIEKYKTEKSAIELSIAAIDDLKQNLSAVQNTIRAQPWMKQKDELILTLARINRLGEGDWKRYQKEADNTVQVIGAQVEQKVIIPLNKSFQNAPLVINLMPELYAELNKLPMTIQEWVRQNTGKRWYRTLDSKRANVELLSKNLEEKLDVIYSKINLEKPNLVEKRKTLSQEITRLEKEGDIQAKEKLIQTLEARMEKILPEWIRGLISIQQMIQYYPLIILGLVLYVIMITISLSLHYQSMVTLRKITDEAKIDPVFSSLWTLTHRGYPATILTIATYTGFVAIMWVLFEMGSGIFAKWLVKEGGGFIGGNGLNLVRWTGRLILAAAIFFIAIRPYYHTAGSLPGDKK